MYIVYVCCILYTIWIPLLAVSFIDTVMCVYWWNKHTISPIDKTITLYNNYVRYNYETINKKNIIYSLTLCKFVQITLVCLVRTLGDFDVFSMYTTDINLQNVFF